MRESNGEDDAVAANDLTGGSDHEERLPGEGVDDLDDSGQVGTTVREPNPTGEETGTTVREPNQTGEEMGTTVREPNPTGEQAGTTVREPSPDAGS